MRQHNIVFYIKASLNKFRVIAILVRYEVMV
jgi:hypothetical protein